MKDRPAGLPGANWFELIVESAPDAILVIDSTQRIALVNRSAERLFGYARAELIGQFLEMLVPGRFRGNHRAHVQGFFSDPRARAMGAGRDLFGQRKDGSEVPIEIGLNPVATSGGAFTLASIIDITERKLGEERLRRTNLELTALNQELDQFVYTASHDLRAPLTGVSTVVDWIIEDDQNLLPTTRERLELIRSRVGGMSRLLADILDYARASRAIDAAPEVLGADALVAEVLATGLVPEGFAVIVDRSMRGVAVSRMPLEQVFHNLISNAIKHHDRGEGAVTLAVIDRGSGLRFSVTDDGPGIPPEYRETVFEMFRTLKPRDQVQGSGIGLALVRKLVSRMGGACGIESPGIRGTRVWFDWPRHPTGAPAS